MSAVWLSHTDNVEIRTSRNESLGDGQCFDLLRSITTLAKVNALDILLRDIILSVRKGLDLVLHQVEDVEPSPERISSVSRGAFNRY